MNVDLISYIKEILHLRGVFTTISQMDKESEVMKIWARWIITHRSLCRQGNLILPDDHEYDSQLIVELQDKGVNVEHAEYLHDWLLYECQHVNKSYSPIATVEYGGIHGNVELAIQQHGDSIYIKPLGETSLEQMLPLCVYNRLSRWYQGSAPQRDGYIWLCSMIYSILDGKGLQWAVPPAVMELLQSNLGCYTELFASPLNAYNKNYYSLFPLDSIFGSKGNFFTAPNENFLSGTFQINPPFIDQLFTKTSERVLHLLDLADRNGQELTFIYIMPEWKDFVTYNMIAESRFCVKQIHLRNRQHYYYQYSTSSYIPARFGSYMFFLSTNSKICSNTLETSIRYAFGRN